MRWIAAFFLGLLLLGILAVGTLFGVRTQAVEKQMFAVQMSEADRARAEMQRLQNEMREVASAELGNAGFPQPIQAQMAVLHSGPPVFMRITFFGLIFMVLIAGGLLLLLLVTAGRRSRSAPAGATMGPQQEMLTIQRILDKLDSMEHRTAALEAQFGERLRSQPAHTWNER